MESGKKIDYIHFFFILSVVLKFFNGLWELVAGILVLTTNSLNYLALFLINKELLEDPNDFIAHYFKDLLAHLSVNTEKFISIYLLVHAFINIFLAVSLLRKKNWAYPLSIMVFGLFFIYEIYRFVQTHSIILIILCCIDVITSYLTWREYQKHLKMTPR